MAKSFRNYARIAVPLPLYREYTYAVPKNLEDIISVGIKVSVPFGKRKSIGYVTEVLEKTDVENVKNIETVLDQSPVFPETMIDFFRWTAEYYIYPIGMVIETAVPKSEKAKPKTVKYASIIERETAKIKLSASAKKIIEILKKETDIKIIDLKKDFPGATRILNSLAQKGLVSIQEKRIFRKPLNQETEKPKPHKLTDEQEFAVNKVKQNLGKGFCAFLLAGVTGSGKTEVYIRICSMVMELKLSAIILVPEIALVSQIETRFISHFGDKIAVLHSGLSAGEAYDEWTRILRKQASIVIGARSAVFAPLENIGIIIVDEEHDFSYKQDGQLHYNGRDIAVMRAKIQNAPVLLGSATPSVQSYFNAKTGKFFELFLTKRVKERPMPEIKIIDLKKTQPYKGISRFISVELYKEIKYVLESGNQVLLFLNKRGFAGFPVCVECGQKLGCKNCDISLAFHKKLNAYKCHYCGYTRPGNCCCDTCGSFNIKHLGIGTEKIESAVQKLFPHAKTARMDRDTVRGKTAILKILKDLKDRKTDILIGTQMITKGHDFPNITLAGIICADVSLAVPDFRAGERTFQILAQVSGRAGRGDTPGKVILQTYNPEHFTILAAQTQDFRQFYNTEIESRRVLNYPPFSRMILLKISGKDKAKVQETAEQAGDICFNLKENISEFKSVDIMGPIEAAVAKIAGNYRWQIILKSSILSTLHKFVKQVFFVNKKLFLTNKYVKTVVDVDPFFMT